MLGQLLNESNYCTIASSSSLDVSLSRIILFLDFVGYDILIHLQIGEAVLGTLIVFSQLISPLAQENTLSGKTPPLPIPMSLLPFPIYPLLSSLTRLLYSLVVPSISFSYFLYYECIQWLDSSSTSVSPLSSFNDLRPFIFSLSYYLHFSPPLSLF